MKMRHAFAFAVALLLLTQSPLSAQYSKDAEPTSQDSLRAARAELQSLKKELDSLRKECSKPTKPIKPTVDDCGRKDDCPKDPCLCGSAATTARRQFIVRRYRWVPASSVGVTGAAVVPGAVSLGSTALATPGAVVADSQLLNAPVYSTGVLNSGLATGYSGFVSGNVVAPGYSSGLSQGYVNGYSSGLVGARAYSPANGSVLPASPNVIHSSYGVYQNGTFSQSLGASGYGTGILANGLANTPAYPTAIFRRTSGYINAMPAPHYAAY